MAEFDDLFDDNLGMGSELDPLGSDDLFDLNPPQGSSGLPDLAEFGLNDVASQDLFGGLDDFNLDDDTSFGAPPANTQPAGFPSFPQSAPEDANLFDDAPAAPQFDVSQDMTHEQRQAAAAQQKKAKGWAGIKEEVGEEWSTSGKNGILRATGTVAGGAVGGSVGSAVLGASLFSGVGTIPAAVVSLAFVAAGAWGGRQVADTATDYDEKAKEYATAKARFTAGIYEEDNLSQYAKDKAIINTWENTQEIERMQDKSFIASAAGFGAEMLPYVAEFAAGFTGKARTIGALITDPKRAKALMNAAKAMKVARVKGVKSVDDGVAMLLGKVGGEASERIPSIDIPRIAKSIAQSMPDMTEEAAAAFLRNYKPSKLMGNPLLKQLITGGIHGVASIPGNEMVMLDKAAYEGTESAGFGKAAARHVTEIMSEYLGAAIFDPITQKPVKALLSKIKGSEKLTPVFKRVSNALNTLSERLQLQAGLPEYWEESAKELMDSMLNINNTGTPQSVRVMDSLTSFVPHNAEQLDLLAKLQVLPLASAALYSATGGRTESQMADYRESQEKLFPFLREAEGAPAITSSGAFDAHTKGFFDLLVKSEAGDRRLFFKNAFGDKVPSFLRYVPGSVTDVYNRETSKREDVKDIETWAARVKEMEEEEPGSGYAEVREVFEQMNRTAITRLGLGDFIITRSEEESDTLKRLVESGLLKHTRAGLIDMTSESEVMLTELEKELTRTYGVAEGATVLEAFNKAQDKFEVLDPSQFELSQESTPTPGNLHTKLFDHVTKFGNISRDKSFRDNLEGVTAEIGALARAMGAGNLKIHLASVLGAETVEGYGSKGYRLSAFNHMDSSGVAHLYIAPGASILDIYEDMHELVLKSTGIEASGGSSRALMNTLAAPLRLIWETLQKRIDTEGQLSKPHDKEVIKTIRQLLANVHGAGLAEEHEDYVPEAVVFEDIAKLLNMISLSQSMTTTEEGSLTHDEYLNADARNRGIWRLVAAMDKESQIYAPLQEVLTKTLGKTLDLGYYSNDGIIKSGLQSFFGNAGKDTSRTKKAGFGAMQEQIDKQYESEEQKAAKVETVKVGDLDKAATTPPKKEAKPPKKEAKQPVEEEKTKPTPKQPAKERSVKDLLDLPEVAPEGYNEEEVPDDFKALPPLEPEAELDIPSEYKGIEISLMHDVKHPLHGGTALMKISTQKNSDGTVTRKIKIDPAEVLRSFKEKRWMKPRVKGVTARPADAFPTIQDWMDFLFEHEYQHKNFPRITSKEEGYVANEDAINKAAAEALGVTARVYPEAATKPVEAKPTAVTAMVDRVFEESQSPIEDIDDLRRLLVRLSNSKTPVTPRRVTHLLETKEFEALAKVLSAAELNPLLKQASTEAGNFKEGVKALHEAVSSRADVLADAKPVELPPEAQKIADFDEENAEGEVDVDSSAWDALLGGDVDPDITASARVLELHEQVKPSSPKDHDSHLAQVQAGTKTVAVMNDTDVENLPEGLKSQLLAKGIYAVWKSHGSLLKDSLALDVVHELTVIWHRASEKAAATQNPAARAVNFLTKNDHRSVGLLLGYDAASVETFVKAYDITASARETTDKRKEASEKEMRANPMRWSHRRGTGLVYKSFVSMRKVYQFEEEPFLKLAEELLQRWKHIGELMTPKGVPAVTNPALLDRARHGFRITLGIPASVNLDTATPDDIVGYVETKYLRSSANTHIITYENGDLTTEKSGDDSGTGFGGDRFSSVYVDSLDNDPTEGDTQAAGEEGEYRALRNLTEIVSAMNLGGSLNRLVVWEVLKGNSRAQEAILTDDAYIKYLYNPHASEKEAALAELLAEHAVDRDEFRGLVQLMDSLTVPGVDEFVFQSSEAGDTFASHVQAMAPRRREALQETLKHNLLQVTATLPMVKHFVSSYHKTRVAAIRNKAKEEGSKRQTADNLINMGSQRIHTIGAWADPIYTYLGRLLNMEAAELRRIDQEYLDAQWVRDGRKEVLDPPGLRMFHQDIGNAMTQLYGVGNQAPYLLRDKAVNEAFFDGSNARINLKRFQEKLASELKIEGHTQKQLAVGTDLGSTGAMNLENIVRGISSVANPLMFRKRTGGLQNNMLMDSHLFQVANENGWVISQIVAAGRSGDGVMRNSNLGLEAFASLEDFHEQDIHDMLRAEFTTAKEGEIYKAWLGPYGDKKQLWRIDQLKLSKADALTALAALVKKIATTEEELENLALFIPPVSELEAESDAVTAAWYANHALVTLQTNIALYGEDFYNDFGSSIDIVKRRGSAVSTGVGIMTEFWADRIAASDKAAGLKRRDPTKMNAIVIEDPKLVPQLMETLVRLGERSEDPAAQELAVYAQKKLDTGEDIADGFALVVDRSMDVLEEGYGQVLTKTGVDPATGKPTAAPRLNIIKTIISNQTDILKQSAGRLSPEFAAQDTGVISMIYDLIQKHEENGGEAIDTIFFSSGAKRDTGEGTTIELFKPMGETGGHKIELLDSVSGDAKFTFNSEQFRRIPIRDVRWQLNAQTGNKPHSDRLPRQLVPVLAEFPAVLGAMMDAIVGNLATEEALLQAGGVPLAARDAKSFATRSDAKAYFEKNRGLYSDVDNFSDVVIEAASGAKPWSLPGREGMVNSRFSSLLKNVETGKTGLDSITRPDAETMIAKGLQKKAQFRTDLHHAVEQPIGQATGSLKEYQAMVLHNGEWVSEIDGVPVDPDAPNTKMAMAHAEMNISGVRRNSDQRAKPHTFDSRAKAVAFMRKATSWSRYLDMFEDPADVKTAAQALTAPMREWELFQNAAGEWVIPGEPVMILRVPADNVYSVAMVRVSGRVAMGSEAEHGKGAFPNVIRTPLSIQIATGSDFDVDKRFVMPLRRLEGGAVDAKDRWNAVMMATVSEYTKSKNFLRIAAPLDISPIERLVDEFSVRSAAKLKEIKDSDGPTISEVKLSHLLGSFVDPKKLRLGHPLDAQRMYNSNRIGRRGLGFVASLSYGLNILNENHIRLANLDEYEMALENFDFIDPLNGATRTVKAGRTTAAPSKNYTTTTKKTLGMFLNLFADHGKLQKIDKLGITDRNVPIAIAMMFAHGDFASEAEAMAYLGNVVAPAMLTPEVQEWLAIQDVANRVGATQAEVDAVNNPEKKQEKWGEAVRTNSEQLHPTPGFQALFRTAESLQSINRLLRAQFTDISDIYDYERTHTDLDRLAETGKYGAWVVSDRHNNTGDIVMPRAFEPTQRIFQLMEDHVFDQSARTSPIWREVYRILFAKRNEGKDPAAFAPSKERVQLAYRLLNQAIAVRSMGETWGVEEGTSTFRSILEYVSTQIEPLLDNSDAVKENPFLGVLQSTREKVPVMEKQKRTSLLTGETVEEPIHTPSFKANYREVNGSIVKADFASRPYLSVLSILSTATFSEEEIVSLKAGFNKLPAKLKQGLVLYALMRHGLSAKSYRGSFLQFVSDEYLEEIHGDLVAADGPLLTDEWAVNDIYDVLNFLEPKLGTFAGDRALAANAMVFDPGYVELKQYWTAQKKKHSEALVEDLTVLRDLKGEDKLPAAATRPNETQVVKLGDRKQYTRQPNGNWKAMNGKVVKDQKIIEAIVAAGGARPTLAPTETAKQLAARQKKAGQKDLDFTASARETEAASAIRDMKFGHFLSAAQRASYDEATSVPRSPMEAVNQAIYATSKGVAWKRSEILAETADVREELKAMVTGWMGDIKGLERAVNNLLAPYYADYPAMRALIKRHFDNHARLPELRQTRRIYGDAAAAAKAYETKDGMHPADRPVYRMEKDYIKGLLDGTIEPYKADPEDQQSYRDRLVEELGSAGADFEALLDGKRAPNLRDSAPHLSASAYEYASIEKQIGQIDNRALGSKVQSTLKLAVRSAGYGAFIAGITAQRIRRHVGAGKRRGYLTTRETAGDRVLQAISVLLESGIDMNQPLEKILREVRAESLVTFTGVEALTPEERALAAEDQRFRVTGAVSVAQLIEEYNTFREGKKLASVETIIQEVNKYFTDARKAVNDTVDEDNWVPEFRLGGGRYLPHLYDYDNSVGDAEHIESEESARVLARSDKTLSYHDAAINRGLVPRTLDVTELIEGWDATIGSIQKNRILFRGLANMTDVFGNPIIVPIRPRSENFGHVEGTIISEEQGEKILRNLIESSRLYFKKNPGKMDWVRDGTHSTWEAINSFLDHYTDRGAYSDHLMTNLGYAKVDTGSAFGLQKQSFWVVKGAAMQAVKHLVEPNFATRAKGDDNPYLYKALNGVLKFNRLVKTVNVGFSLFHHFALTESWLADSGWTPKAALRAAQNIMGSKKLWNSIVDNPAEAAKWVNSGLQIDAVPMDVDLDLLSNGVDFVAGKFDNTLPWMGKRLRELNNMKRSFDNFLWHKMLPVMKIQMAEEGLKAAKASGKFEGLAAPGVTEAEMTEAEKVAEARMREDIAKYVNDALGSQEWQQYLWATPMARDAMNTFMFAPDWTISALNVSGIPEIAGDVVGGKWLGYTPNTKYGTWRRVNRYWPGFYTWIFLAIPSAMQAAITAAYGDDDEDDKFFPWQNEKGRQTSMDITPMIRHAAKKQGVAPPTRRLYAQPGKQIREIGHWLHDPVSTLFGKSSAAVRVPITATTGVIKPSLRSEEIWSARNDADKWEKIAGNLMPFAATSLSRTEVVGGAPGFLLTMSMPRVSGLSGIAAKQEISSAVTSFAEDRDVIGLAPAVAKKVLDDRVSDVRDRLMRQGTTDQQWKQIVAMGMGEARGKINRAIKDEAQKPPGKVDGDKMQKLLIASAMIYGSNKKARQNLESSIKNTMTTSEASRSAPQKMLNLSTLQKGAGRKPILDAGKKVASSKAAVYRVSTEKLKRRNQ